MLMIQLAVLPVLPTGSDQCGVNVSCFLLSLFLTLTPVLSLSHFMACEVAFI